jgi:uncharacterized protein (TIGR03435 family)
MAELSLILKATVVLAIGLAAAGGARRSSAAVRALIVTAAFGVLLLLPAAPLIVPPGTVTIPVPPVSTAMFSFADEPAAATRPLPVPVRTANAGPVRSWPLPPLDELPRLLWLAGTFSVLLPLVAVHWRVRRLGARASRWHHGDTLAARIARPPAGRDIAVLISSEIQVPMTYGVLRPRIVLPVDAPAWPDAELRQALLHELEHVRRCDWLVQTMVRVACAIYWFHPLAWSAWRRLRLECEQACDDAVLQEAERTAYAEQLVMLARRLAGVSNPPLLSMADGSHLSQRVSAVLDGGRARGRVGIAAATTIAGLSLAMTAVIAPIHAVEAVVLPAVQTAPEALGIRTDIGGPPFEAASIRPNAPADRQRVADWHLPSGRFTARNQTLGWFIAFAYAPQVPLWLEERDVIGGPDWIDSERFTIEATAGRTVTTAEMQRLVRQLLADRFALRVHVESRRGPAYRLVLSRGDRRLGPQVRVTQDGCGTQRPRGSFGELGLQTEFSCITMARLAVDLSERVGRPVIDRTGVAEVFDATLTAARTPEELAVIYGLAPSALPSELLNGVSIFTALPEQLGVKLEPIDADLAVLVIDAAERPSPNDARTASPQAATAAPSAAFEVASIKRNRSAEPARGRVEPGGRFTAINTPVLQVVRQAYGVFPYQVLDAPDWVSSDGYDIITRLPDGVESTPQTLGASLRTLLESRFGFVARMEQREMATYELVLARQDRRLGPKLRQSSIDCTAGMSVQAPPSPAGEPPCALLGSLLGSSGRRYQMRGFPLDRFTQSLTGVAGRPVVDKTGLTGTWNLDLEFTPENDPASGPGDPPGVFTALEEQLGLKLQPSRGAVDVLVVDRVERPAED